jgi:hypothetical protein
MNSMRRAFDAAFKLHVAQMIREQAEWGEFDLERAEGRIPAERMKMREPHIVPLSK